MAGVHVDDDGAVGAALAEREIVDADQGCRADLGHRQRPDQPASCGTSRRLVGGSSARPAGRPGQGDLLQDAAQQWSAAGIRCGQLRHLLGEGPPPAGGVVAEEPADTQLVPASAGRRSPGRPGPAGTGCAPAPTGIRSPDTPRREPRRRHPAKPTGPRHAPAGSVEPRDGAAAIQDDDHHIVNMIIHIRPAAEAGVRLDSPTSCQRPQSSGRRTRPIPPDTADPAVHERRRGSQASSSACYAPQHSLKQPCRSAAGSNPDRRARTRVVRKRLRVVERQCRQREGPR